MKKLFAIVLALMLCVSALSVVAFAAPVVIYSGMSGAIPLDETVEEVIDPGAPMGAIADEVVDSGVPVGVIVNVECTR